MYQYFLILFLFFVAGCTNLALVRVEDPIANQRLHAANCVSGELHEIDAQRFAITMQCVGPEKKTTHVQWARYSWR